MFAVALFILAIGTTKTWAGPPFRTDDPEPVDHKHGEFYIAAAYAENSDASNGALPQFEFNYGVAPDVMIHIIAPFAFNKPHGEAMQYGFGDLEAGVKYRFLNNENAHFELATFPLMDVPSGDSDVGLGAGHTRFFIPLWVQKSWESWTTYGGGGYWRNPGEDNKDYWFCGWEVQRDMSKTLTVGAELFAQTKTTDDGNYETGFNIGAIVNLTDDHHLLFSAGRDFRGDNRFSAYLAYQYTFGPREAKK